MITEPKATAARPTDNFRKPNLCFILDVGLNVADLAFIIIALTGIKFFFNYITIVISTSIISHYSLNNKA